MPQAIDILIDLHKRRRLALGEPEQFVSREFTAFVRDVSNQLAFDGMARTIWLEVDGNALSALFLLLGADTVYAYQSGMDTNNSRISPGWILELSTIRMAILEGFKAYDMLRGDEPYKLRYRPKAIHNLKFEIPAKTFQAKLYYSVRKTKRRFKKLIKRLLVAFGIREYEPD
jgi:CelD/BcsL family acetyltransferase involved in cellulose biosynthesis